MSLSGCVTCQILPGRQTNVAHLKICFEIVLETLSLPPLCSGARTQLSEEDLLGEARVHQPDNMTSPTQLIFDYHGLDTGALCLRQGRWNLSDDPARSHPGCVSGSADGTFPGR